jgi:uncharacterized protein (UPF0333 family)
MLDGRRKGQIALEFLIVYSLVLLIFVIIFALVVNQRAASLGQDEYQSLQLAAQNIAIHMDQAIIAGNGYSAIVPIPPVTSENPYKLFISTSGVVEANITIGITKAEAIAYSSARNLVINGTAVTSFNGVTLYNVSTYTGSIEITNANGAIYIDELPPSTSFLADSMYIHNKGITKAAELNGSSANSYIYVGTSNTITFAPNVNSFTMSAWVNIVNQEEPAPACYWSYHIIGFGGYPNGVIRDLCNNGGALQMVRGGNQEMDFPYNKSDWYLVTGVYNASSSDVALYINGNYFGGGPGGTGQATTGNFVIGSNFATPIGNVLVTNVQLYNSALTSNQIKDIYGRGISGSPVSSANVVGWWPLDGNANDYSGSGNNGVAYNIKYVNLAQINTHATLSNGDNASHALIGADSNTGGDIISPQYITQPNLAYVAGITHANGNATVFLTSNTPIHSISGQAFLFNGNSSTAANLRGWWPLEESTGNKVYDFSGYFNAGSFTDPHWQPLRETSTAFKVAGFDGSSYDNATTAETYSRGITISAWINNTGTGTYGQNIAEVSGGPYTSEAFDIGVTGANGQAVARWNNQANSLSPGSASAPQPAGGTITANTPYLVTGVWNGANNTITVYVNGNPVATSPGNGTYAEAIGKINIGGAYAGMNAFSGRISNVQVYNTSLQQSYIKKIYQNGIDGAPINNVGLVGWFPLDGEPNDYSTNNYPTSSSNIAYYNVYNVSAVAGVPNGINVASFNGSSSASSIAIPPLEVLNGHHSYSINTWLEYKGGSQYFGQNPFPIGWPGCHMGFMFSGSSTVEFANWYTSNANNPPGCPTSGSGITPTGASILPNVLYMLTGTYNASTGKLNFYVNGQYYSNATVPSGDYLSNYTETGYIGDALDGNTATKFFNGSVADLQIYNISLTPYEIKQLYANGLPPAKGFNFSVG